LKNATLMTDKFNL